MHEGGHLMDKMGWFGMNPILPLKWKFHLFVAEYAREFFEEE